MTPAMTRDEALAEAKKLYGARGDTVKLGVSHFVGYQISKDRWNWIGHGQDWQSAIADVFRVSLSGTKSRPKIRDTFGVALELPKGVSDGRENREV